jgi:hypothetical protein
MKKRNKSKDGYLYEVCTGAKRNLKIGYTIGAGCHGEKCLLRIGCWDGVRIRLSSIYHQVGNGENANLTLLLILVGVAFEVRCCCCFVCSCGSITK